MSIYGAEFVKSAAQLLAVDGEDPPNLQFKVSGCVVCDMMIGLVDVFCF